MKNIIKLHNTLSGNIEEFKPIKEGEVSMYHCGPTVYNYLHIGNLRAYLMTDLLRRMFEANNYNVKQVINITDVGHLTSTSDIGIGDDGEDKMEKMATSKGQTAQQIADFYTAVFYKDIYALHVKTERTLFPKATDHIAEQIALIEKLEQKNCTYKTSDGIYFDTSTFSEYGKLGSIDLEGLKAGARVETNTEKRNITDFALWKFSPTGPSSAKRDQEWPSPWGVGFPGWHIECSAMAMKYLGNTFDIHTGGIDHIPVHHNNEIAQSESANGAPLAHYWLHNAFVNVPDGKMSKSKENFIRLETLVDEGISPLSYRYWLMTAHYSSQVQFSLDAIKASQQAYTRLIELLASYSQTSEGVATETEHKAIERVQYVQEALLYMSDDLDSPKVLALIWNITKDTSLSSEEKRAAIFAIDEFLGLDLKNQTNSHITKSYIDIEHLPPAIKNLLEKRQLAREEKNWSLADSLRIELEEAGFTVTDSAHGQSIQSQSIQG